MVRSSSSSHRMSGSDSSQMSTFIHQLTQQHQSSSAQHGYDSAVGSSAGISSPPRNTTPSVSSYSSGGMFSSPPSWASSPPTSPDSAIVAVNYIPEEPTTARITIPTKKSAELQQRYPTIWLHFALLIAVGFWSWFFFALNIICTSESCFVIILWEFLTKLTKIL